MNGVRAAQERYRRLSPESEAAILRGESPPPPSAPVGPRLLRMALPRSLPAPFAPVLRALQAAARDGQIRLAVAPLPEGPAGVAACCALLQDAGPDARDQFLLLLGGGAPARREELSRAWANGPRPTWERPRVILLQPRRVAARLSARRIAFERGGQAGGEVGYQVRFERRIGPDTRIEVLTEGLLTRRLQADPFLEDVSVVILDEFHERSQHADLALALLRELQLDARPDLKLLVMSATLDPGPVAAHLGGCPVLTAPGRAYPIEIAYDPVPDGRRIEERVSAAARALLDETTDGHLLCFLPGVAEIERCRALLDGRVNARVLPLHGRLRPEEQDAALAPCTQRKIVLSTNLAETSVTLDGVVGVVDSGQQRAPRYDPTLGIERLERGSSLYWPTSGRASRPHRGQARAPPVDRARGSQHRRRPARATGADLAPTPLELLAWGPIP